MSKLGNFLFKYYNRQELKALEGWNEFLKEFLMPNNEKDAMTLGGSKQYQYLPSEESKSDEFVFEPEEEEVNTEFYTNVYWKLEVDLELEELD